MNLHESKANCNLCIEKHGVSGDEIDQAHEAVKGRMIAMNRSQFIAVDSIIDHLISRFDHSTKVK